MKYSIYKKILSLCLKRKAIHILLIEDKSKVADFVERGLRGEQYAVDVTSNGEKGLCLANMNSYDLIILDLMVPNIGGLFIYKELRNNKIDTSILRLTPKDGLRDKVKDLHSGADDYLPKSLTFEKLLARMKE